MSSPTTPHDPVDTAAAAEAARDRRARITWSLIAEPSDAVALLACTVLGHTTALELAENGTSPDLLRARSGDLDDAPDAVVRPGDHDEVQAVLDWAVEHHVAVVPFGGGTSVTGGLVARREGFAGVVSLDLARLAHEQFPQVSVVVVSGRMRPDPGALPPGTRFVPKPYSATNLTRVVQEALAKVA